MTIKTLAAAGAVVAFVAVYASADPMGTVFTYQGKLADGGNPAQGTYDMRFAIWDAATNGNVVAGPLTNAAVGVSNGLFAVALDFGGGIFNGDARWLELGVRSNGLGGGFATLAPRQALTPVPCALYATNAGAALSVAANGVSAASLQDNAIAAGKIASNQVVKSVNSLHDAVTLAAGANVTLTPAGQTLTLASPDDWHLLGNVGTTPGTHFVGTTDNKALELKVNNTRALRLEPNTSGPPNVIGGAPANAVVAPTVGATISGGAVNTIATTADYAAIGGGGGNQIGFEGRYSTIGGGQNNLTGYDTQAGTVGGGSGNAALEDWATVGGGGGNTVASVALAGTVGGGQNNTVGSGSYFATVGGGSWNTNNAYQATIAGGYFNQIGDYAISATIAGGEQNKVLSSYATVGGGTYNTIQSVGSMYLSAATIGGGYLNTVGGGANYAAIAGGCRNTIQASALSSAIGGGTNNTIGTVSAATIGGGSANSIQASSDGASIAGGSGNTIQSGAWASAIGGGGGNYIGPSAWSSTIAGGLNNVITDSRSTIGGGMNNTNYAITSTIGGGGANVIYYGANNSTIAGGNGNYIGGWWATVPGGSDNFAYGWYSLAGGRHARANDNGCFVWADSQNTNFNSTAANQVSFRCTGGARFVSGIDASGNPTAGVQLAAGGNSWSAISDRNAKENFRPVNHREVLERLVAIPVTTWNLKSQPAAIRHIGPMAQDFAAAFGVGEDDRHISTSDADGVTLAAIQGLNEVVKEKDARIDALEKRLAEVEKALQTLTRKQDGGGL